MNISLIDIGSNTIRLLICEVNHDLGIKRLKSRRVVTRLGNSIVETKSLCKKGKKATIKALLSFLKTCRSNNVSNIYAIATSALRESIDGKEFVREIKETTGIDVEIISGEEEAGLTLDGIKGFIDKKKSTAIVDIGGGSTEFIYYNDKITIKKSLPIGVVGLKDLFLKKIPPSEDTTRLIENHVFMLLKDKNILNQMPDQLIITGGSATTLACIDKKLKRYNPDLVHLHVINLKTLDHLIKRVSALDIEQISKIIGLDKKRADLILPGMLVIKVFLIGFNLDSFTISDYGLLEGLALKKVNALSSQPTN
ncbi:MAG: hypothetical protein SNJ53_06110 [Thermodesulfovibrionales bacterium]